MMQHRWFDVTTIVDGKRAVFKMSADAFKQDGIRRTFTPLGLASLCETIDALPPTPFLLDQRFVQASITNFPSPKLYIGGIGMATAQAVKEHSERIDAQLNGFDANTASVGNVGKHWIWPLEHEQLYGWHLLQRNYEWRGIKLYDAVSPDLKVIQRVSRAHAGSNDLLVEPTHIDYSMTGVVVHKHCTVDGEARDTLNLYRERSPFVFGPTLARPGVPARTREGDQGADVLAAQQWLMAKGLDPGPLDGTHGRRTEAAWQAWETRTAGAVIQPLTQHSFKQARFYSYGRPFGGILWVVVHTAQTIEHAASAERLQSYAATMTDGRQASWHEAIDNDSVAESVLPKDRAWAAGPANDRGYHIELACYAEQTAANWDDAYSRAQLAIAARRVALRCKENNIPVRWLTAEECYELQPGICGHDTITEASKIARQRGAKIAPWWNPQKGAWRTSTHVDPGLYFPRDRFVMAVEAAMGAL